MNDHYIKVPEDISLLAIGNPYSYGNTITTYDVQVNDPSYIEKYVDILFMRLENQDYSPLLQQLESEKYETIIRNHGTVKKL